MELVNIIKDHIKYRQQIFKLAKADLTKTYRGAALGWAWAIIKPTVTIFVYWFAFQIGLRAGKSVNGYSFFLWLIAGLVPWFYMGDMISQGTDAIRKYKHLVNKMKFPVCTIPTFFSMSKYITNLILIAIVIVIFMFNGFMPDIYYLQIPFYILLSFIFFTAWSLFGSMLSCISKDFANLVKSFVTAVFWLSGILWNPDTVSNIWLKRVLKVNPVTYLVTGFRNCFINKVWFWQDYKELICFIILTIIMIMLSLWAYKKLKKEIPDVL